MDTYLSRKARGITPYVAGEQPRIPNLIKLNTNENPYPPSPRVLESIAAAGASLRLYPKTDGGVFREAAAEYEGVSIENIFCANGSDELLAFAYAAFFDTRKKIKMPEISYSFYPVWAALFDIPYEAVSLRPDLSIDETSLYHSEGGVIFPNPNAPTGLALPLYAVEAIVRNNPQNAVIIDEAYAAFGASTAAGLVPRYGNTLIVRTLSKSHALAGLRCGYAVGSPSLIDGLQRIRDSFNSYPLDCLAQAGAAAALRDRAYYEETTQKITDTRERMKPALKALGFDVPDSLANFLYISHPAVPAVHLFQRLREKHVLVRHFGRPLTRDWLRVTVGTDAQMDVFLEVVKEILSSV